MRRGTETRALQWDGDFGLPQIRAIRKTHISGLFSFMNFPNRDLLKVNPKDGRCGFLTNSEYHTRILTYTSI